MTMQRLANRYMALLTNVIQGTARSLESLPAIAAAEPWCSGRGVEVRLLLPRTSPFEA